MSYLNEHVASGVAVKDTKTIQISGFSNAGPTNNQVMAYNATTNDWTPTSRTFADGLKTFSFFSTSGASWHNGQGSGYRYEANSNLTDIREQMQAPFSNGGEYELKGTGITRYDWGQWRSWYSSDYPRMSGCYVPAGKYYCRAVFPGYPSASSGYAVLRWAKGPASGVNPQTGDFTQVGPHFYVANREGRFAHLPTAIVTTTATSTLLALEFIEGSSFERGNASSWLKYFTFHVTKIGD